MADTLIREGIAYGSQPLSPVGQYWNGASYEKVQGDNGAAYASIVGSAGDTVRFSAANPGSVKLTATSTVAISGSITTAISGTATVAMSGNVTAIPSVIGTQANAWSASATVTSGATSNAIDLQYNYNISYFGTITNTASVTLNLLVSQDNSTYYTAATATITAGTSSNFHYSTTTAARYARLMSTGVSATITATIAGK